MGLIGTRSLTTEIPGITTLVEHARERIGSGILAFDALQRIRAAGSSAAIAPADRDAFEQHGPDLGYALLLKRYLDDPRQATPQQIDQAAWDTVPTVLPLFWSFRIMVGLGFFFILLMATFFILSARRRLDAHRWLLKVAVYSIRCPGSPRKWAGSWPNSGASRGSSKACCRPPRPSPTWARERCC